MNAYEIGCDGWALTYDRLELTGNVKLVNNFGENHYYYQVQRRLFGIPLYKTWISEQYIRWFDDEDLTE